MLRILITGASSGIGLATALRLARAGHAVVGASRDPEGAREAMARAAGGDPPFSMVAMDLEDGASRARAWAGAEARLGGVDVLINNAGRGELGAVEDTPLEESRRLFEANYWGAVDLIRRALPGMRGRRRGIIVNLGSVVHDLPFPFKAQYCASKSALTSFSLSLRYEVEPHGIRVHLIEPGWVRSDFHNRLRAVAPEGSAYARRLAPFTDYRKDADPRLPDGAAVAGAIARVIDDPRSPVRVAVGADCRKVKWGKRLLPAGAVDRLMLWKLNRKGEMF